MPVTLELATWLAPSLVVHPYAPVAQAAAAVLLTATFVVLVDLAVFGSLTRPQSTVQGLASFGRAAPALPVGLSSIGGESLAALGGAARALGLGASVVVSSAGSSVVMASRGVARLANPSRPITAVWWGARALWGRTVSDARALAAGTAALAAVFALKKSPAAWVRDHRGVAHTYALALAAGALAAADVATSGALSARGLAAAQAAAGAACSYLGVLCPAKLTAGQYLAASLGLSADGEAAALLAAAVDGVVALVLALVDAVALLLSEAAAAAAAALSPLASVFSTRPRPLVVVIPLTGWAVTIPRYDVDAAEFAASLLPAGFSWPLPAWATWALAAALVGAAVAVAAMSAIRYAAYVRAVRRQRRAKEHSTQRGPSFTGNFDE